MQFVCRFMLLLCLSFTCLQARMPWQQAEMPEEDEIDLSNIYYAYGASLYDQAAIVNSEEYQQASEEERQEMLKNAFSANFSWNYAKSSVRQAATTLAIGVPLYVWLKRKYGQGGGIDLAAVQLASLIGGGLIWRISDPVIDTLESFVKNNWYMFKKTFIGSKPTELDDYEIKYVGMKPHVPHDLQKEMEERLLKARIFRDAESKKNAISYAKVALTLPQTIEKIDRNEEALKQALHGYKDPTLISELRKYYTRYARNSLSELPRKIVAYFYGLPGTGKTRAAYQMAAALRVPIHVVPLANVNQLEDLIGNATKPGLLLEIVTAMEHGIKPVKNMIILFDDADRIVFKKEGQEQLQSYMLTLLEPNSKDFYSPFLKTTIDISHLGIIIAGNTPPDQIDPALRERLDIITFPGYSIEQKREIVWAGMVQELLKEINLTTDDLDEADKKHINELIEEADQAGGIRILKAKLTKYLQDVEDKVWARTGSKQKHELVASRRSWEVSY